MFVALALVVALEREPEPLPTLLALIGAVLALLAGELYEAAIEAQIQARRSLLASEFRDIAYEQSFITAGAIPSIVIFICASAGLLSAAAADNVAVWAGVGLLAALGVAAGLLARERVPVRRVRPGERGHRRPGRRAQGCGEEDLGRAAAVVGGGW